jgi:hypothetical protein
MNVENTLEKQLKGGKAYLGPQFQSMVHGRNITVRHKHHGGASMS